MVLFDYKGVNLMASEVEDQVLQIAGHNWDEEEHS